MSYAALYMSCAAGIAKLYIKCYFMCLITLDEAATDAKLWMSATIKVNQA